MNSNSRRRSRSSICAYEKDITKLIQLGLPFSLIKIKISNRDKLVDFSKNKTFIKVVSHAILMTKKSMKNNKLRFYHDSGEIIVILSEVNKSELIDITSEVYNVLITPILMNNKIFILQPIMGCVINTSSRKTADEIIRQADISCYKAKKSGLGVGFYSASYSKSICEEIEILNKLVYAIPNNEFKLYYQPIVKSSDKTVHGYEALIRWFQDDGTIIPPDKFIKIAERNNKIKVITRWVINQVVHDINEFKKNNIFSKIHINISTLDLHDNDLYEQLSTLVNNRWLLSSDIILEVTESALMADADAAYLMLEKLSELGFYISIDDFGTGYSSLSLLRVLPFNQIKIDQSFIRNMTIGNNDYAIVTSTIYLAHNLGCNVVAEGVEDEERFTELKALGCDFIQGYYISKPKEFAGIIREFSK
ncbi:putative bifunctional diguanylate cyclase/phosphodiesterase [Aliivibrio finisterrensis]|nr:GGDEF domain-containing phosphodiesterase [Aliivibrio finisterrensis]